MNILKCEGEMKTMDSYMRLKLEFQGIKNVIEDYSSSGHIGNYLIGMEASLENDEVESVLYYLDEIYTWYQQNIGKIQSNEFVYNLDEHYRNINLIDEICKEIKDYDFTKVVRKNVKDFVKGPKIFLSHRSSDKKYGDALEKVIIGLGVKNDQLIYTSHPLHKIPLNENIYDYLRKNINQDVFVIILWSNEYLESPSCLNEMGASWVTQSDYINMYTPEFSFGNPKYHECAVDTRKMGAVLKVDAHCKANMVEFRNRIIDLFGLKLNEQTWTYLLDQFIIDIE